MTNPENERRPKQIIPTEPPPPPGRAPEQTIPDDGPPVDMPPPSRPSQRPPEHAPSQRAGGRVKVKRRETPPDRAALIIDRQRGATNARAIAGICSAAFSSTTILG